MEPVLVTFTIAFLLLVVFMVGGIPVPFAFAAALIFMVVAGHYEPSFLLGRAFAQIKSIVLLAVPFFIVAGYLMEKGGISRPLINLVNSLIGRIKGGLGMVTIVTCGVFGAISGSSFAAVGAIGPIMTSRMKEEGYPLGYATSLVAVSAVLALLIPPSLTQIVYGWASGTSVAACFLSTTIPAITLIVILSLINYWMMRKKPLKITPRLSPKERVKDIGKCTKNAFWALLMPIFVLGGIYGGLITPTEAAAVAVVYSMLVGLFIYRGFGLKGMLSSITDATTLTGVTLLMVFCVLMLVQISTMEGVPQKLSSALMGVSTDKNVILLMINVFLFCLGLVMGDTPGTLLSVVILWPVITAIGVHPVHFAAIIGVNLGMGLCTQPSAPLLYLAARISGAKFETMIKPLLIFIIFGYFPVLGLTTYIPELSLFLPRLLGYIK